MSKERNHNEFPDRETLMEYLKGGLSFQERHRIEKLMLEHEFFREIVEGLESEDPELIGEDLMGLSMSIRDRAGLHRRTGFNLYSMAATISLVILASVVIFLTVDWLTRSERSSEISLNKPADTETEESREIPKISGARPDIDKKTEKQEDVTGAADDKSPGIVALQDQKKESTPAENKDDARDLSVLPDKIDRKAVTKGKDILTPQEPEQVDERTKVVLQNKEMESASQKMKRSEPAAAAIPFEVEEDVLAEKLEDTSTGLAVSFMTAANLPQPVGGFERYQIYLDDSLRYPESALNNQVEGSVIVSFTVDADSIPHQLSVIKSLGYGCDEEALRLIREGPRWKPAISAGKILESEMKIPVNFKLPEGTGPR